MALAKGKIIMLKRAFMAAVIFCQSAYAVETSECKNIESDKARLLCYDKLHGYKSKNSSNIKQSERQTSALKRSDFSLLPHKQSYFMPVSYTKERRSIDEFSTVTNVPDLDDLEVRFQISFKMSLWDDVLGDNSQLMAAYTQKSYWQMYNADFSSLFRETNYEPEIFINKQTDIELLGFKLVNTKLGFVHQSNGRSDLFSRSWNRVYADFVFQKDNFAFSVKPWRRIQEDIEEDDNPDINDYLGNYEVGLFYQWGESEFTALTRNIGARKHQASYQLGWLYPLNDKMKFYIEYFHGYGESLIDYDYVNESIGIGFTLNDWVD